MNPGAICAALEAELATRTWWDEEPCLYALRAVGDGVELRPLFTMTELKAAGEGEA